MKRRGTPLPPNNMLWLRDAIEDASLSYNKNGDLVKMAHFEWKKSGEIEQNIVTVRDKCAMFFVQRWNDELNNGEGGWESKNAIAGSDLDDLYAVANDEQRYVLDNHRWNPL
jgi:hypothetical protein